MRKRKPPSPDDGRPPRNMALSLAPSASSDLSLAAHVTFGGPHAHPSWLLRRRGSSTGARELQGTERLEHGGVAMVRGSCSDRRSSNTKTRWTTRRGSRSPPTSTATRPSPWAMHRGASAGAFFHDLPWYFQTLGLLDWYRAAVSEPLSEDLQQAPRC